MNKLGFGFLRLPRLNEADENSIDIEKTKGLVDRFIGLGGRYFDTAYTYMNGGSEAAIREALVERYPRDRFLLADKLPSWKLKKEEDCQAFFEEELRRCGVQYFDYFLLHGLDQENYEICERLGAFEYMKKLRAEGKARKIGFSYHDSPAVLDEILTKHPEMEFVQLQINYLDWKSVTIQAEECYRTAVRHNKRVIVMEPVKGGSLASLPGEAEEILRKVNPQESAASWAIRFASMLPQVDVVLSGMNTTAQIEENMRDLPPLTDGELAAIARAAEMIRANTAVPCTGCSYCTEGCPKKIAIPKYFALYNEYARSPRELWKMEYLYKEIAGGRGRASECIACGRCERACPQKIGIIENLKKVKDVFEA